METAQATSPRSRSVKADALRSLRPALILAAVALGTGALLLQPFGLGDIFPSATASIGATLQTPLKAAGEAPRLATGLPALRRHLAEPAPAAVADAPPASAPTAAPTAAQPDPAPANPVVAAAAVPDPVPIIPPAVESAPPPARAALPLQTSVAGRQPPRIDVAARPVTSPAQASGSTTRPAGANPNG